MTEVFTGLPEQDILLTEFFLEKLLWRRTAPEFFYMNTTGDFFLRFLFQVLLLLRAGVRKKKLLGVMLWNKTGVSVGAGWCGRVQLWSVLREGEERGGSGTPELNVTVFWRCCGLNSKTHLLCGRYGDINEMPVLTKVGQWELILNLKLSQIYIKQGLVKERAYKEVIQQNCCDRN